jgi:peptidyl-prolyl cis-trans isomerase D
MLGSFRGMANTLPARIFFLALAAAFVGWGVSGKLGNAGGDPTAVAVVNGQEIPAAQFAATYHRTMRRVLQQVGNDPSLLPPQIHEQVAQESLRHVITQTALDQVASGMGLAAPASVVQSKIMDMNAFQGMDGKFDHNRYLQVLNQNNLTPQTFQDEMQQDVRNNQLLDTVTTASDPSQLLTGLVFTYVNEARTANVVNLLFNTHHAPADPGHAVLDRFYANHIKTYTAPEYRHVHIVVLSPATIGRTLPITDADLHAYYDAHKHDYEAPEKRSLQVITASSDDVANALAAQWKAGTDWATMQAAAKSRGASAAELKDTVQAGVPSPELGKAAFAAPQDTVVGPITEPLGVQLVKVISITPAKHPDFESLRAGIRQKVGEERAMDLIDPRAQKLQDLLAGGSHIDEIPADLGAAGTEGTLDAQGNTPSGEKAPIPAPDAEKAQILADAFKTAKGETTQLTEAGHHVWYALSVDDIIKPAAKPFDSVAAQVLADWQKEQVRHDTETDAAKLVQTVNGGQSLTDAAWGTGQPVTKTPPLFRTHPTRGVPPELSQLVFTMKKGQATMVETNVGFMVAQLADITKPDPQSDKQALAQVREVLSKAMKDMYLESYTGAVTDQAKPRVVQKVVQQITQAQGE